MAESAEDRIRRLRGVGIEVNPNQYAAETRLTSAGPVPDSAVRPHAGNSVGDDDSSWRTYWATIGQPVVDNATASAERVGGEGSIAQTYRYARGFGSPGDIGTPNTMEARPMRSGEKLAERPPKERILFRGDTGLSKPEWDASMAQADAPASGVLPGEEQVTTRASLGSLSAEEQNALRKKYESGGHSGTMSYDDWLTDNFGELPPVERQDAMRRSATATPRIQAGRDPSLPPETNTPLADSRRAAGKPLPEGRAARQYAPEQRAAMTANVESPEVPMTAAGGSYTQNVDGTRTRRAPNQEALGLAAQIEQDPEQGPQSGSYLMALAQAYHIDAAQYGDDMDLLRADVMREKAKHDKLGQYLGVAPNPMSPGQYMYVEDSRQRQAGREQFQRNMTPQQRNNAAISMSRAYTRVMTDDDRARIAAAVRSPSGMAELEDLRMDLKRRQQEMSWANHLDRVSGQALGRDMANPERARGFMIRSLAEAVRSGDPMAQAAAYSMMGQPMQAIRAMDAAMNERNAAAQMAMAEGQGGEQAPSTMAAQLRQEVNDAMMLPAEQQEDALFLIYQKAGYPPEQIQQRVDSVIIENNARSNPAHPKVQAAMRAKLKEGRGAWMQWAQSVMGLDEDQAKAVYEEEVGTAAQAGERTATAAAQAGADAAGWVGGFARGLFGGGFSPQAYGAGN